MGIMHTFSSEILSEILQKIKLPSIKRIMKQSRSIKNQIIEDYFLWKSKCNPGETSLDTKKLLERVKKDTLIATALVKHRMKPKIIVTYQTDITMIKASPQFVITSSDDSSIKAYSLTSMNSKKFLGHKGGVWDFSFNNKFLASSSIDKTVKLWNFETGECVLTLNGHTATVRTVKLVEDRIISGGRDGSIRIWDYKGNCIFVLENHKASVRCLDIYEDELLSGSYDGSVLLWNWKTGKLIKKLSSHESRVYAVLICNDFYISSGQDCLINVYSKITKNSVKYKLHKSIISNLSLCYFENKPFLISAGLDGIIGIWDIYTNQLHTKILEAPGLIHVKSFNKYLVVGLNNSVKVYNAKTGKYVRTLLEDLQTVHFIEFTDNVLAVGFRSNSKCAVYVINFNEYIEAMYHRKDSYKVKEALSKLIKF